MTEGTEKKCNTHVKALTYNMSWATQADMAAGSERDFVEQCWDQKRNCYNEALNRIEIINNLEKFDVIGIQECEDPQMIEKIQSRVPSMTGYYRAGVWNPNKYVQKFVGALLLWNTEKLGNIVSARTINLAFAVGLDKDDGRPCGIVLTDKGLTLIVAHFPWLNTNEEKKKIAEYITKNTDDSNDIVMLADTNDSTTLITRETPFEVKGMHLSQNMSYEQLRENVKSCCWHKPGHEFKKYSDTGDYVLGRNVLEMYMIRGDDEPIPGTGHTSLYSDHKPVVAHLCIELI